MALNPSLYLYIKAFHVMAVIAWMAGLLYLPRLFVYHTQKEPGSDASETFKTVASGSPLYASSQELAQKSLDGETLPYKDPTTAGVLAGVLPGLGHVYCNRYKDGAVAFLLNGLFIWAAVESFHNDNDVLGAILVFAEVGWYTGNIYSAVNSAHKYNRKLKDDFLQGLPDSLNLGLLATRQGHLGLTLSFSF